jgi:sulfur relay (sulfurtransferase) complex TusBCD TusD component (DsrE family)
MKTVFGALALGACLALAACQPPEPSAATAAEEPQPVLVLNVTSDPQQDPHSVTMALQLAGHGLDDGREVVLFFNVRAVPVATVDLPPELAFHAEPIADLLAGLVARGAEVHVCPHCMKALEVPESALIQGAVVTSREALFGKLGRDTQVFSY